MNYKRHCNEARRFIEHRRQDDVIDRAALHAATHPKYVLYGKIASSLAPLASFIPGWGPLAAAGLGALGSMSGGGSSAGNVGNFYQNALGQLANGSGSPLAAEYINQERAAMQPVFDQQNRELAAREAAMGITGSGAAKADFSDLAGGQARALAESVAPLYGNAMNAYASILGGMPGAQANAFQNQRQMDMGSLGNIGQLLALLGHNNNFQGPLSPVYNPYQMGTLPQTPSTPALPPIPTGSIYTPISVDPTQYGNTPVSNPYGTAGS